MEEFKSPIDLDNDGDDAIEMSLFFDDDSRKKTTKSSNNSGCCIFFLVLGASLAGIVWHACSFI